MSRGTLYEQVEERGGYKFAERRAVQAQRAGRTPIEVAAFREKADALERAL